MNAEVRSPFGVHYLRFLQAGFLEKFQVVGFADIGSALIRLPLL